MNEKVLIPNRGIIALDIIHSLNRIGLETAVFYSPEDHLSLPVKMADYSYKFYSSRLEDSYLDLETIVEKAKLIGARYIHPGWGFLSESPAMARACRENGIHFIGPSEEVLAAVGDKLALRKTAANVDIPVVPASDLYRSPVDFDNKSVRQYPVLIKPLKGLGGIGIRFARSAQDLQEKLHILSTDEQFRREGVFIEEFWPDAHHIEIPFFRDVSGNILFLPEIESSIQRRFQKIFQESPSVNLPEGLLDALYSDGEKLIRKIDYVGFGYIEFLIRNGKRYFLEINPTFQINTLMTEIHLTQNLLKKQFAVSRGEPLHHVQGVRVVEPKHHVMLVSLMAEDPFNSFQPSSGTVNHFFHYSTVRNVFKTTLYTGARVSDLYDPFIGKILTYAFKRENTLRDMRTFLDQINIRGIRTNLIFLKHLLECEQIRAGQTVVDFLKLHFDFSKRVHSEEEQLLAAALLASDFHIDNRRKNYKQNLEKMKQPGLLKRLLRGL